MTNEEMVYYLKRADITVGQKNKTKTAEAIECAIKALEQQPKRGKWISIDDGGMRVDGYCSECNIFIPKNVREIMRDYCDGDFCPNCGADMREVQDDGI